MLIKAGVDISRLNPEIRHALHRAAQICKDNTDEIVITSTFEGNHLPGSYHYGNDAFDFTARRDLKPVLGDRLRNCIREYFDIVWEGDHIHVEFDRQKYNQQQGE